MLSGKGWRVEVEVYFVLSEEVSYARWICLDLTRESNH